MTEEEKETKETKEIINNIAEFDVSKLPKLSDYLTNISTEDKLRR